MASTTTNVGAIVTYMTGTAATASSNQNPKDNSSKAAASFDNILNQVSDTVMQTKSVDTGKNAANQQKDQKAATKPQETAKSDASEKSQTQDNMTAKADKVNTQDKDTRPVEEKKSLKEGTKGEISEEAKDAIEKAGEEIAKELTEILDITEEDLLDMMEILGLTFVDLFNPESLQQLVTQIGGQEQALNLITDSDIYTSLQDLIEGAESMKDELMNEFDLSEEDFTNLMTQDKEISFKEAGKEIFAEIPEDHLTRKVDLIRQDFKMPHQEAPQSEDVQPIDEPVIGRPVEIDTQSEQGQHKNGNHFQNGEQSANLFNQIVDNIAEAAVPEAVDTISYTDRAQMENIIRQITDKITISASAETKSIELSLHPASLGNVNILLSSSKDGIVAKFTAQNEIVKEAVESQMMQLQQKFEEQGIKVTSIEVTIASHAFEQNLQNQDRSGQEEQPGAQKKNLRRINLFEMTQEEEDDMTEAERIAAQMMAMNGNTVDFSA